MTVYEGATAGGQTVRHGPLPNETRKIVFEFLDLLGCFQFYGFEEKQA